MRQLRNNHAMRSFLIFLFILGGIWAWGATAVPIYAHERVEIGPYTLIVGWENEPVIVDERNAIVVYVSRNGAPITDLEGTLRLELLYAGRSFRGNLHPSGEPGRYRAEVLPTVRGQYTVRLFGQIEDLEIDELVDPEEVLAGRILQFPEAQPDQRELLAAVAALEDQVAQANRLAIAGLIAGLLGIGVAGVALVSKRRSAANTAA
jgi:hypothetical protein